MATAYVFDAPPEEYERVAREFGAIESIESGKQTLARLGDYLATMVS